MVTVICESLRTKTENLDLPILNKLSFSFLLMVTAEYKLDRQN
jgi:hypothetical protein